MTEINKDDKKNKTIKKNTITINPDLSEAPLSVAQRAKKAIQFRKISARVQRGKKRAAKRMASSDKLQKRSEKQALLLLKKKVAGNRGADYRSLSRSQKVSVDRAVEKRKGGGIVKRLAKRLFPTIRKNERERLKKALGGNKVSESYMVHKFLEEKCTCRTDKEYKRFHELYGKDGKVKHDRRFKFNRKIGETELEEHVHKILNMVEDSSEVCDVSVTDQDIRQLERFANEKLSRFKIRVEFTKHFKDRMNDERNKPCISIQELKDFFLKVEKNKGKKLKKFVGEQKLVIKTGDNINIPCVIEWTSGQNSDFVLKTIMRKKKFSDYVATFIEYP